MRCNQAEGGGHLTMSGNNRGRATEACCMVFAAAVLLLGLLVAGCSSPEQHYYVPVGWDRCGYMKPVRFHIVNGSTSPDPAVANLSPSQQDAIGLLVINDDRDQEAIRCTGTLIAPRVVLTAAHCFFAFPRIGLIQFVVAENATPTTYEYYFETREYHVHPLFRPHSRVAEYDIAVVILREDAPAGAIAPIPPNLEITSLVGETVQVAGYGNTAGNQQGYTNTLRLWTTLRVERETELTYIAYGDGATGVCVGDSGGPMLYTKPERRVYVMAVISSEDGHGPTTCLGRSHYPRTDQWRDFLRTYVSSEPTDPCRGETLRGRCDEQVAIWCESGTVQSQDCAAIGQVCTVDAQGHSRCAPAGDMCHGETFIGRCDGNIAVWCQGGAVRTRDCAACHQTCGYVNDSVGFYCQ